MYINDLNLISPYKVHKLNEYDGKRKHEQYDANNRIPVAKRHLEPERESRKAECAKLSPNHHCLCVFKEEDFVAATREIPGQISDHGINAAHFISRRSNH